MRSKINATTIIIATLLLSVGAIPLYQRLSTNDPIVPGTGQIWLDNLRCGLTANRLIDCPGNAIGVHNCQHSKDVGVRCEPVGFRGELNNKYNPLK